jgi:hypothetical protein
VGRGEWEKKVVTGIVYPEIRRDAFASNEISITDFSLCRVHPPRRAPAPAVLSCEIRLMQTAIRVPAAAPKPGAVITFDQPVDATTLYRFWGAHLVPGGVRFAVWAPNAREVSVICDSNGWTAGRDWLHSSDTGVCHSNSIGAAAGKG